MSTSNPPAVVAVDPDKVVKLRKALLGSVDFAAWPQRLTKFMAGVPGVAGNIEIGDLSLPSAGGSSGTLLYSASFDEPAGNRVTRRYVLRFATQGGLFHSYDLAGQYSIQETLRDSGVPVPVVIGIDRDGSTLGVIGYVMERVEGETAPPSYYHEGLLLQAAPEVRREMVMETLKALAQLHKQDISQPGFDFLWKRGNGATALARDLDWHWSSLLWGCPEEVKVLQPIRDWLLAKAPPEAGLCVCHGDAMFANYMFRDNKLVAVLDWELAFIGNPACDIAWQVLTHVSLGVGSEPIAGIPDEAERIAAYEQFSGAKLANWEYCVALTALKLHAIHALVYREVPPELEAQRKTTLDHTWHALTTRLAAIGWKQS